ncbi:MAG: division/cell wall cluster transcriptional repressor MraZ [Pseudomonadota bacterium]
MFLSTYENTVDAKGRVSIPAPFRAALGGADHVLLWPSFEGPFLEGGGAALLESYRAMMRRLPPHDKTRRAFMHAVFGRSRPFNFDSTGRIVLDRAYAQHASITGKALFVGLDDRFQVWSPEAYAAHEAEYLKLAAERSDLLTAPDMFGETPYGGEAAE